MPVIISVFCEPEPIWGAELQGDRIVAECKSIEPGTREVTHIFPPPWIFSRRKRQNKKQESRPKSMEEVLELLGEHLKGGHYVDGATLEEFLTLPEKPEAALKFISKYGVLFQEVGYDRTTGRYELALADFWGFRRLVRALLGLWAGLRNEDGNENQLNRRASEVRSLMRWKLPQRLSPAEVLAASLSYRSSPRMITAAEDGSIKLIFFCTDVASSLLTVLIKGAVSDSPWNLCEKCGQPFVAPASRPNKRFHDRKCQEAAKSRRHYHKEN